LPTPLATTTPEPSTPEPAVLETAQAETEEVVSVDPEPADLEEVVSITAPTPATLKPIEETPKMTQPSISAPTPAQQEPVSTNFSASISPVISTVANLNSESGLSDKTMHDIPTLEDTHMTATPNIQQPPAPSAFSYPSTSPTPAKPERTVIKNKNDAGSLLKVVGITILALVVTVGIGVGIGVGLLNMAEKKSNNLQHSPVTDTSPAATSTPTAAPTVAPSPSPVATPAKEKLKILIVNATTTAGKAGKFKSSLQAAGYKSIETGNAKGTYTDKGTFLLGSDPSGTLTTDLGKALGVTLVNQTDKAAEDAKGAYDVVIVIAE
jgi:hypothetical protein